MNTEQLITAAINLLESSNPRTREQAVEALGLLRSSRVTALLSERLLDQDDRVRKWAAWALGQIEGPATASNHIAGLHSLFAARSISITEVHHLTSIASGVEPPPPSNEPPEPAVGIIPPAPVFPG
jgi:HEAT repeat protein